jgi:aspartyl-tRNA(Asn)/glutamyl-tRNA(Gln) amidotransferase subunit C
VPVGAPISPEQVAHVARLARLALSDEERERFARELAAVLEHAADLEALDTSGVEPTAHPLPIANVLRHDEPSACLDRTEVLAAAPARDETGRFFLVPRILSDPA